VYLLQLTGQDKRPPINCCCTAARGLAFRLTLTATTDISGLRLIIFTTTHPPEEFAEEFGENLPLQ